MSWTDPETKSTGNLITAAYWNQMLGPSGNQVLTAPGVFTTAGDIIYGTGDNATTRLASSGGGGKFLQMNGGATAPAWVTALTSLVADTTPQLGGFLDANGNYIQMQKGGDIASASPTVIDTDGDYFSVTGTTGEGRGARKPDDELRCHCSRMDGIASQLVDGGGGHPLRERCEHRSEAGEGR